MVEVRAEQFESKQFRVAEAAEDEVIARHFYQLWLDNQVSATDLRPDWQAVTLQFIQQARQDLQFQAFVAVVEQQVVGSVSCQLFAGLYPLILTDRQRKYGYIWGVYVEPQYRRQGLAKQLTQLAIDYLKSLHCTRVILHASPSGKPLYEQLGFVSSNEMRLDLPPSNLPP